MKKFLLSFVFLTIAFILKAQYSDKSLALQLVSKNSNAIGLSNDDLKNTIVSSTYYNQFAGTQMVYLQQSYLGLPVYNQMQVLAFKNGKLVSAASERIAGIGKLSDMISAAPSLKPERAIMTALTEKKISTKENILVSSTAGSATKLDFGKLGVALENVTAELMWVPIEEGKEIKLAWEVYLVPKNSSDYFLIRVDANENKIIGESNLTVYCNFGDKDYEHVTSCIEENKNEHILLSQPPSPSLVGTANYLVVPWPAESPTHPGGTPALRTNPWTLAGGNATSLGWHNDGVTDYTITRGNNVHAQEDRDNNNGTLGLPATSTTGPDPLNFNFIPDFTVTPIQTTPVQNQQFNITNLFYWNNIIHDITYLYGFDEAAGNFQNDNQGLSGLGGDYVIADAQDAGGTNNANFSTPVDGLKPRMQMYLWSGSPQKDGDADNGIIVHEYGHGISNRLTGGPANSSCLQNGEQMGEGWSDYYSLMYTQDWANSTLTTGFTTPRGIGTYVKNQPFTGLGIRSQRYCTDFAVNNKVYAATISAESHNRGEIWCATLWDMTWNIINQVGSINPNLFNPAAGGGNAIALKLVTEGMKLQPCSPGFISGRNAILQADQILYGGLYNCAIREAFRRRGMGVQASQGSSGSVTDQVPDFSGGFSLLLKQNGMTQVQEGQNIVYTNTVNSSCAAISGFTLRDTLPANVTYVSGGTYDATTRVISFPVSQAVGEIQNYSFTVNVNNGSYFTPIILIDEQVITSTIPSFWTTTATPAANIWSVSSLQSQSPPNSFYVENLVIAGDQKLETTNAIALPAGTSPKLSFSHLFNTEEGWDGGVVEISTNGGGSWTDLGPNMATGGYNGTLGAAPTNALSNRSAFTGTITSFMTTSINLTPYAGQNVNIRFRFGSDDNTSAPSGTPGWFVDNILLNISPVVNMRSSLFNSTNVRVAVSDTVTVIIPAIVCTNVGITTQPLNNSACIGNNAAFSVTATGTSVAYQWQVSTDGGINWSDIAGATSSTYTVTGVTEGMDNYRYRVIINNSCPSAIASNSAILTVSSSANIGSQPSDAIVCPGSNAIFTVGASGSNLTYQWQVSTNNGTTFTNIADAINATFTVTNVTQAMSGYQYRVMISNCGPSGINSNAATLSINTPVAITTQPGNVAGCSGSNVSFSVAASGTSVIYQWQISVNSGSWLDLANTAPYSGVNSNTLNITAINTSMNGYRYRVIVSGIPCGGVTSSPGTLIAHQKPGVVLSADYGNLSPGVRGTLYTMVSPIGTFTYQWFRNGVLLPNVSTSSYPVDVDRLGDYSVNVTDSNGCSATSNLVHIGDSVTNVVFIYPNPNIGQFQVRFYSANIDTKVRMITIYDAKGARVYQKTYLIARTYDRMDVDMKNRSAGIYMLELRDVNGGRLATGRVILQ